MQNPAPPVHDRIYKHLARRILAEIIAGKYPVGSRLPAERELAIFFDKHELVNM